MRASALVPVMPVAAPGEPVGRWIRPETETTRRTNGGARRYCRWGMRPHSYAHVFNAQGYRECHMPILSCCTPDGHTSLGLESAAQSRRSLRAAGSRSHRGGGRSHACLATHNRASRSNLRRAQQTGDPAECQSCSRRGQAASGGRVRGAERLCSLCALQALVLVLLFRRLGGVLGTLVRPCRTSAQATGTSSAAAHRGARALDAHGALGLVAAWLLGCLAGWLAGSCVIAQVPASAAGRRYVGSG